jgi:hypothetical protein
MGAGFLGMYGTLKLLLVNGRTDRRRRNIRRIPLEVRQYNMLCFWALWHIASSVKKVPFFKFTMSKVAPKFLLVEIVVMMLCLNYYQGGQSERDPIRGVSGVETDRRNLLN